MRLMIRRSCIEVSDLDLYLLSCCFSPVRELTLKLTGVVPGLIQPANIF